MTFFEIAILMMVSLLSLILTIYNRRQASALNGMARLVEDFVAMHLRDRRALISRQLQFDPLDWISKQINNTLKEPLSITEVSRVLEDAQALEIRTGDNRRLVISPFTKRELLSFDHRLRAKNGSSASDRVKNFAAKPLLSKNRWGFGVKVIKCSISTASEFFDLEAEYVGKQLGLDWGQPSRLWFYVVS